MGTTARGFRYPAGSAAPNVPQDMSNLAADVDAHLTTTLGSTAWTPAFGSSITTPSMNNSTQTGRYWQTMGARVDVWARIRIGTTFSAGGGNYSLTLPVPSSATYTRQILQAAYFDFSAGLWYSGVAIAGEDASAGVDNQSEAKLFYNTNTAVNLAAVTTTAPFSWFTGDLVLVTGFYYTA